eukprot:CAMPEP_0198254952 /NCGR_PEP_ID=MMETSP1447-20131203/5193_1 /TAXON_ID=420782 /ORGANISM="Chaetoceros dichaeta, Strain CCMP1751" /LENGTH=200 /DNA_ID=CAMNT_0043941207 /DNA_START=117 /DNA_END=719 /DNA_ORIENTATION=-
MSIVSLRLSRSSFLVLALLAQFLVLDEVRAYDDRIYRTQSNHTAHSLIQAPTTAPISAAIDRHNRPNVDQNSTLPPTPAPNNAPSNEPSTEPSREPSNAPSTEPSREPSNAPSNAPSTEPSLKPSNVSQFDLSSTSEAENLASNGNNGVNGALITGTCVAAVLLTATGAYYKKVRDRGQGAQSSNSGNGGYTDIEGGSTS